MLLPNFRAFLVRFSNRTDSAADLPQGRIEHIESGLSTRFGSLEEMRDFMATVLDQEDELHIDESCEPSVESKVNFLQTIGEV